MFVRSAGGGCEVAGGVVGGVELGLEVELGLGVELGLVVGGRVDLGLAHVLGPVLPELEKRLMPECKHNPAVDTALDFGEVDSLAVGSWKPVPVVEYDFAGKDSWAMGPWKPVPVVEVVGERRMASVTWSCSFDIDSGFGWQVVEVGMLCMVDLE